MLCSIGQRQSALISDTGDLEEGVRPGDCQPTSAANVNRTPQERFAGPGRHRSLSVMRRMPPTLPEFVAVYGLLYAAFGVQSPFLPALLREQGLHPEEIGIVLGASTAIRVLAGPAIGHAADRLHRHTSTLCGCALVAAVAGFGYLMMHGLGSLLVVGLLHAAMLAPIVPLSDALATTAAHASESDGRTAVRLWMAACVWLGRIHHWHDDRVVGLPGKPACQA